MSTLRRNVMLGTAGHVDHGKSALVKLLTGCETDTLAEEKQRGLTIDLGFAPCRLANQRVVGIVDVPGHVDFIRNMVAGAHGIDVVIFVVAADDGIMPQTREHLHILTLMGLRHGLIALTKTDLVDAARREFVIRDLRRLLADTFLANAPICPISNITCEGFDDFFDALNKAVEACGDRPCAGPFRMWVEDAFTIRGTGTVVTGIPTHGRVRPGDKLHLFPAGLAGHVAPDAGLWRGRRGRKRGGMCCLEHPGTGPRSRRRGMTLCGSEIFEPALMAEAELQILNSIPGEIEDYLEVQFHVGTGSASARLAMLENTAMTGGQKQLVQLRFAAPLPLVPGERFVVRANVADAGVSGMTTIGGGQILGLSNARLRRKKPWTLALLAARREAVNDPLRWCELMVRESQSPATVAALQKTPGAARRKSPARSNSCTPKTRYSRRPAADGCMADTAKMAEKILPAVQTFHAPIRNAPASASKNSGRRSIPILSFWRLRRNHCWLQNNSNATALCWRRPVGARAFPTATSACATKSPPHCGRPVCASVPRRTGRRCDEPLPRAAAMARLLAERGMCCARRQIWMHRDAVEGGKQTALKLFRLAPAFSTMEFRDALGVSRKFAVPLVDYLDKIHFTVRSGNNRTPGVEAKKLLGQNEVEPSLR